MREKSRGEEQGRCVCYFQSSLSFSRQASKSAVGPELGPGVCPFAALLSTFKRCLLVSLELILSKISGAFPHSLAPVSSGTNGLQRYRVLRGRRNEGFPVGTVKNRRGS